MKLPRPKLYDNSLHLSPVERSLAGEIQWQLRHCWPLYHRMYLSSLLISSQRKHRPIQKLLSKAILFSFDRCEVYSIFLCHYGKPNHSRSSESESTDAIWRSLHQALVIPPSREMGGTNRSTLFRLVTCGAIEVFVERIIEQQTTIEETQELLATKSPQWWFDSAVEQGLFNL